MAAPNPTTLTSATRFRPLHDRPHSRSPSRSPVRRTQFQAQQLDPLLSNLSPQSTLIALQATETISSGGTEQDTLTRSIAEATTAERELGIRAAFAAHKVKEWHAEVTSWSWPKSKRECALGIGFVEYAQDQAVEEHEDRVEEIRDLLDTLGFDEIKDHVLEQHTSVRSVSSPAAMQKEMNAARMSYGRMRDFTALITATVIQALPDLAHLNMLLDAWDVRCTVLRRVPALLSDLRSAKEGIRAAAEVIHDPESGLRVTREEIEITKSILGDRVSSAGSKMDKLLDQLEGHDDALPQAWVDDLEKIELDYATWVVDAERLVMQNELRSQDGDGSNEATTPGGELSDGRVQGMPANPTVLSSQENQRPPQPATSEAVDEDMASPGGEQNLERSASKRKPALSLDVHGPPYHRRGVSEVSVANSMYSTFSDISQAEIIDARSTQVLPSPKISVVDNPFRASRDELTWFGNGVADSQTTLKPPLLQRASTASFEVVPKENLKRVTFMRNSSQERLSQIPQSPPSTPSKALRQLTGDESPTREAPDESEAPVESRALVESKAPIELGDNARTLQRTASDAESSFGVPSPSLAVEPLRVRSREAEPPRPSSPSLPRKSSKREPRSGPFASDSEVSSMTGTPDLSDNHFSLNGTSRQVPAKAKSDESLEAKIQDILGSLPANIRMANDLTEAPQISSNTSTRGSTPTPALTLAPAKPEKTSRQGNVADAGVRVFHLMQSGQPRDSPPVKLFVRAVGENGERVMVRVGGGWADLGEYLREYSAHHGRSNLSNRGMEVANFPDGSNYRDSAMGASVTSSPVMVSPPSRINSGHPSRPKSRSPLTSQNGFDSNSHFNRPKSRSPSNSQSGFDFSGLVPINNQKSRGSPRVHSPEPPNKPGNNIPWTPPPVPPIPATYTMQSPKTTTTTGANGTTHTDTVYPEPPSSSSHSRTTGPGATSPKSRSSTISSSPGITTTTTIMQSSPNATKYTPLGGAGPRSNSRRAVTHGTPESDVWVEGMVGKARAVSGGHTTTNVVHEPTITTTTTVMSSTPSHTTKRASSYNPLSATSSNTGTHLRAASSSLRLGNYGSLSPPGGNAGTPSRAVSNAGTPSPAPPSNARPALVKKNSNRLSSFGEMSGIRRVFLRRKTSKSGA